MKIPCDYFQYFYIVFSYDRYILIQGLSSIIIP